MSLPERSAHPRRVVPAGWPEGVPQVTTGRSWVT